ncbi:MAG: DUF4065 domain-containing protein [Cyanobacteriota bacterium]|nr:DUF4065 domain-containing protein [Cyanobacteriota bacterium]
MLNRLIEYFVHKTKGHLTKTQLVKFLYLADLYAVKWTEKQLTELNWCYYQFGPWPEDIDSTLERMNNREITIEQQSETIFIKPGPKAKNIDHLEIPLSLKLILDKIGREWAGTGQQRRQQLLDYVYNTAPMLEVKDCQPEEKVQLNLHKEREILIKELDEYSDRAKNQKRLNLLYQSSGSRSYQ